MKYLAWFSNNWEKVATTLAVIGGVIFACGLFYMMTQRSYQRDADTPYTKCLQAVLYKGTVLDAETMCSHLRTGNR